MFLACPRLPIVSSLLTVKISAGQEMGHQQWEAICREDRRSVSSRILRGISVLLAWKRSQDGEGEGLMLLL